MAQSSPGPAGSPRPRDVSAAPAKKPRSPAERIIVWGGILLLLGLAAYQARARFGYSMTLNALQDRLAQDEGKDAQPLLVKDLDQYVVGWPARRVEEHSKHLGGIELTWSGLTAKYGMIVAYDPSEQKEEGGAITGLQTKGYTEPSESERKVAPPPFSKEEAARLGNNIPPGAPGGAAAPGSEAAPASEPGASPADDAAVSSEPAADQPAASEPPAGTEAAQDGQPAAESPAAEPPAATQSDEAAAPAEQPAADSPATTDAESKPADEGK